MTTRKKSWKAIAKRHIGKTMTHLGGYGQFSLVTPCRGGAFSLWLKREEAEKCKRHLDRGGCCGGCWATTHYIVIVDLTEVTVSSK